jgi:hypothetical protein
VREGKGTKERERVVGKAAGGRGRLYTWRRARLADEVGSDAIPDTAGGEGGHGGMYQGRNFGCNFGAIAISA